MTTGCSIFQNIQFSPSKPDTFLPEEALLDTFGSKFYYDIKYFAQI